MSERSASLVADCEQCAGLCCVAPPFARSVDFAFTKPAEEPCVNLDEQFRCRIHAGLRESGFKGCTVFDCHGAGPKVTQVTFGGLTWHDGAETAQLMFAVFAVVRQLHDMLWYLHTVRAHPATVPIHGELDRAYAEVDRLTRLPATEILRLDLEQIREPVNVVLRRASDLVRRGARGPKSRPLPKRVRAGRDLIGVRLAGADLRGADLRGSLLIAADLTGADLRHADLIGADLRDADLSDADLSATIFLTQMQVNAARGNAATRLPDSLRRPTHWPGSRSPAEP